MENDKIYRAFYWLTHGNVGVSSKALLAASFGVYADGPCYPRDGADFRRCVDMLEKIPEAHEGFTLLSRLCPYWHALITKWDDVAGALADELKLQKRDGRTYILMRTIFDSVKSAK